METPALRRGERVSAAERSRLGRELLAQYNQGRSIRELCQTTGYSIGRVRRLLIDAGVKFRSRGGPNRRRSS
ncbi:MAG: helix-turn-helix domain-containing protein [Mycobacteriales bacterium]